MSTEKEIKNEATVVASAEQTANAEVQTPKKRSGSGVNNGHKDVVVKIALLTEYKDEDPIRIGKKGEAEKTKK